MTHSQIVTEPPARAAASADPGRWLVLANPAAGSVDRALAAVVAAYCRGLGVAPDLRWTAAPGHAAQLLAPDPDGTVPSHTVVLGGDGTLREVAQAVAETGSPTVLLTTPSGTGNSFHRALWGDADWPEVLAAVGEGRSRTRRIDLMRIAGSGRSALLGASSGFIAEVTRRAADRRGVAGRDRYLSVLTELAADPPYAPERVTVDGRLLYEGDVVTTTVGGGRHRVGVFAVLPQSVLDDGLLDICVIARPPTAADRDALIAHVLNGTHVDLPGVYYARGGRVLIERLDDAPLVFEHDGEVWTPPGPTFAIDAVPSAVPMAAPLEPVAG
jgi:diacylglycerol kinase (ATP)